MAGASTPVPVGRGFTYLIAAAALAAFGAIVMGGVVRVTDSGLGCPDWPLCYGQIIPPLEFHTILEYTHRLSASLVLVLVGVAVVIAWWRYRGQRRVVVPLALAAAFLLLEAGLGAIAVLTELQPVSVTVHLAVAQGIFAFLLVAFVLGRRPGPAMGASGMGDSNSPLFRGAVVAALASYVLTLSGAYVVGAGATVACLDWPLCGGDLLPSGSLTSIHMLHRLLAALLGGVILWGTHPGWRARSRVPGIGTLTGLALGLLVLQVIVGAANPWLSFDGAIRALHLALATALGGSLVVLAALAYGDGSVQEAG